MVPNKEHIFLFMLWKEKKQSETNVPTFKVKRARI